MSLEIYTSTDARTKSMCCPYMNGDPCKGKYCMKWVWHYKDEPQPIPFGLTLPPPPKRIKTKKGFCGA